MRYAMIMAGGAGTRLWPMSRRDQPKQLIPLIEPTDGSPRRRSLLEVAVRRLDGIIDPSRIFICTGERYRSQVRAALPGFPDAQILGEPVPRDTVNAVGFAAAVLQKLDPDAIFAVLTSDHVIEPQAVFRERIELGFELVEQRRERFVTFWIKPTFPATGYGYIECRAPLAGAPGQPGLCFQVDRFVEKPDLARAQEYVQSKDFGWNSGMFVWHVGAVLEALRAFCPDNAKGLAEIQQAWGTASQQATLERVYPTLPKSSVDIAMMEAVAKDPQRRFPICAVKMEIDWLDVGSWPSYAQTLAMDASESRHAGAGAVLQRDGRRNLVVNAQAEHTIAMLGCEDLIVVHTPAATLIMPRQKAEELKDLHAGLDDKLK